MRDLSTIRDAWRDMDAEEVRLLRALSVNESLRLFSMLFEAYEPRFREDASYWQEQEAAVLDLRRKILRLPRTRAESS